VKSDLVSSKQNAMQAALVLHTRPYSNTSLLVDFFCKEFGLLRCVAKGQRSKKNASLLSQFCILDISFSGKSELKTLQKVEPEGSRFLLEKQALLCGLYANELLLRVLINNDPHPQLFEIVCELYQKLSESQQQEELEVRLRYFEFMLLKEIGYLVDFKHDFLNGETIRASERYIYETENGFSKQAQAQVLMQDNDSSRLSFSGETLETLDRLLKKKNFLFESSPHPEQFRKECKVLTRLMLAPYLGDKPLQSRALFESFKHSNI
jgi:DNA repair protein RecO (recombination protein O)